MKKQLIIFMAILSSLPSYSQVFSGTIRNFNNKTFALYAIYADSLIFIDSIRTNNKGEFSYPLSETMKKRFPASVKASKHIAFRIQLNWNQFADVIGYNNYGTQTLTIPKSDNPIPRKNEKDIVLNTVYHPSQWNNFALDSGMSPWNAENKTLYDFYQHYKKVKVAEAWLLEMSRLFPYSDEFSQVLIKEYYKRYKKIDSYYKALLKQPNNPAKTIALAFYKPVLPSYDIPDGERFKIFRQYFWNYFNPNDSIFLFSSVLIDKFEEWVYLHHHHKENIAGLYLDKADIINAINSYIEKIDKNDQNRSAVLNYALRKLDKDDDKTLFLQVYDRWLNVQREGDCGEHETEWQWAHQKASVYRNIVKGALAPHFDMELAGTDKFISLYDIDADYIMLVFWATWCPHCQKELPQIKDQVEQWQKEHVGKRLQVIAISLDTNAVEWHNYIQQHQLFSWIHYSELKGWKGNINKQYHIIATPSIVVIDENKKIYGFYPFIEKALYEMK